MSGKPDDYTFWIQGLPIPPPFDRAIIVRDDGRREPLKGFTLQKGETILEAIERSLPDRAKLIIDV